MTGIKDGDAVYWHEPAGVRKGFIKQVSITPGDYVRIKPEDCYKKTEFLHASITDALPDEGATDPISRNKQIMEECLKAAGDMYDNRFPVIGVGGDVMRNLAIVHLAIMLFHQRVKGDSDAMPRQ